MSTPQEHISQEAWGRAVALAWEASGSVHPNPPVGAVIVKSGRIVGTGHTQPAGQRHAEIVALQAAGSDAEGADLYVTLEPCAHHGRTPPCVDAIIASGIRKVVFGAIDPNPITTRRGLDTLRHKGIEVVMANDNGESLELIEAFRKHVTTGLPFVAAKFAMSLDGKIATHSGDSKWISGPAARRYSHNLRSRCDAIMVGIGTVIADDPQLTVRDIPNKTNQPTRVIVDTKARLSLDAALLREKGETIVYTGGAPVDRVRTFRSSGIDIVDTGNGDRVNLTRMLANLGQKGITSILLEGGSRLLGSMFDEDLVDKVIAIIAPVIIGGERALSPVGGHGAAVMQEVGQLEHITHKRIENDIVISGYPLH